MPRAIWKGAISFGLVHIPVALVSATSSQGIDFDWLDKRSMERVGYKKINKVTGKEIKPDQIVKGVELEKGRYVVLSEDEIREAHPKSTQTIDIFAFLDSKEIPLPNIDTPYYLSPDKRGEKVYALLRTTLEKTQKVALARVIVRTRQHLAALMPLDSALVLVMLRWPAEVRSLESIELGDAVTKAELSKGELEMARRLVEDMTEKWKPDEYQDTFTQKIMDLVEKKARDGKVEDVEAGDGAEERKSADIIDLTELLKRSLGGATRGKKTSDEKSHNKDDEEAQNKPKRKPASKAAAPKSAAKATKAPAKKSATSAKAAKDKISEKPTRTPPKRTKAAGK